MGASTEVLTDVVAESQTAQGGSLTTYGGYGFMFGLTQALEVLLVGMSVVIGGLGAVCRLYGFRASAQRLIARTTSSTSFRVSPASIGSEYFIGDSVVHPAYGRIGDNRRLVTKVAALVDGEIRANTGVLGSNSFEIPRSIQRATRMAHLERGRQRRAIAAENRYDIAGTGLFLVAGWFPFYVISLVLLTTAVLYDSFGVAVIVGAGVLTLLFEIFSLVLVERAAFKNVAGRLLGVRVFDDGCAISEKTLTAVGDGCTLRVGSLVHHGVTVGEGAVLAPDSFSMKGEDVPPYARWGGNPAREIDDNRATVEVGGK